MVYASCKESVTDNIEKKFGIHFDKKVKQIFLQEKFFNVFIQLEICDPTDLTKDYLMQQLHPEIFTNTTKSSFAKPKAPSRGPRRLIKAIDNPDEDK